MPELPDLNVFSKNLSESLAGKKLVGIVLSRYVSSRAASGMTKALKGKVLEEVYREGKELRFLFKAGQVLGIHLMLRGKLVWIESGILPPYTLAQFLFSGGRKLALTDPQKLAKVQLNPDDPAVPDALSAEAGITFWKSLLKSRAIIKNIMLNQHMVRGIGNAYADEILWTARISPFSTGNKIPDKKINALARALKKVVKNAEKQIRLRAPGIIGGEVRDFLVIHNAKKKASPGGSLIKHSVNGGRKTYYTDEQELFK